MTDIEKLKELAGKATKGVWRTHLVDDTCVVSEDGTDVATTCDSSETERDDAYNVEYERMEADAAYIAAANPSAVIELLDELTRLRAQVERMREDERARWEAIVRECAVSNRENAEAVKALGDNPEYQLEGRARELAAGYCEEIIQCRLLEDIRDDLNDRAARAAMEG